MSSYGDLLSVLPSFKAAVWRQRSRPREGLAKNIAMEMTAFSAGPAQIHATGIGISNQAGPAKVVFKVFVFQDADPEAVLGKDLAKGFDSLPVELERLPVQSVRATTPAQHQKQHRPIVAGVSISPLNVGYVGTLGGFLTRQSPTGEQVFALSNNHVLANTDRLPVGTPIVQAGPESPLFDTREADIFARLENAIEIRFNNSLGVPVFNLFDAAVARVADRSLIKLGKQLGITKYDPSKVVAPAPDMRVIKSGRTTGVTRGQIRNLSVDNVQINYGTQQAPRIAVFNDTVQIFGDGGQPFSLPGDSGSVILEESTGHPVALLFAGDGVRTTACELGELCRRLDMWPA